MPELTRLFDAPLGQDLQPLSVYWWEKKIPHQITEQSGRQVVWSDAATYAERMQEDYRAYTAGELVIEITRKPREGGTLDSIVPFFRQYPVTLVLVLLSAVGYLLVEFDSDRSIVSQLTIQGIGASGNLLQGYTLERISPAEFFEQGQYWRMITPVFLHFGILHLVFNMLWLWELGRRIEKYGGAVHYASIVFFIGVASNLYQAASTPLAIFGGMSGVIFGLLGYFAIFNLLAPRKLTRLPIQYYALMLATLVVGWLGIFDFLARMANTAHTMGFVWGCFIAIPSALMARAYWSDAD